MTSAQSGMNKKKGKTIFHLNGLKINHMTNFSGIMKGKV